MHNGHMSNAILTRGRTTPGSNAGSFRAHQSSAPTFDLVDSPEEEFDALDNQQGIGRSFGDPHMGI